MLELRIERIGELAVVECKGRIVRSEAAFKLRRAVTSLEESKMVVLDLSEVSAIEGGGLGMLLFLERWAFDRDIQFKLFNPSKLVRERLELVSSIREFIVASLPEMIGLRPTPTATAPWLPERIRQPETAPRASTRAGDRSAPMRRKPLILCVDDTPSWLEGQKMLLEDNGYRVLTATNGTDAIQAFLSHSVDLVLLDYHMPGMNGGGVAARMKDSKPDVPVALWSGDERLPPTDLEAVDCFIPKCEPINSVLEKVDYLVSLRFLFQPFSTPKAKAA